MATYGFPSPRVANAMRKVCDGVPTYKNLSGKSDDSAHIAGSLRHRAVSTSTDSKLGRLTPLKREMWSLDFTRLFKPAFEGEVLGVLGKCVVSGLLFGSVLRTHRDITKAFIELRHFVATFGPRGVRLRYIHFDFDPNVIRDDRISSGDRRKPHCLLSSNG